MINFTEIFRQITARLERELPKDLYYHGLHHTMYVMRAAEMIGRQEGVSEHELLLLKVAALYHDAGFVSVYNGHEKVGCDMAQADLPGFGISPADIEAICGMILATKIPQTPHSHLEKILADADLEYLGTDLFESISNKLSEEWKIYRNITDEAVWNAAQISFLQHHQYHTDFCRAHREAEKDRHLAELILRTGTSSV